MSDKLTDRLQQDRNHSVDRRRVSEHSKRYIAEAIRDGDTESTLRAMFEVLTGDVVSDHPTVRDVTGDINLGSDVQLSDNQTLTVKLSLGDMNETAYVSPTYDSQYYFSELPPGDYSLSVRLTKIREYDFDMLDVTEYDISDATVDYTTAVTVDPTQVAIGTDVTGPTVSINSLTINDSDSGGSN